MADLDHIEQYLRGELTEKDAAIFEASLEQDVALQEKVEKHRQMLKGIEIGFNSELKELLIEEESKIIDTPAQTKSRIRSLYPIIGVAAAVALMIVSIFVLKNNRLSSEELYAQYYKVYPNVESPVSRSESSEMNPFVAYEVGDYTTALANFTELRRSDPDNAALVFYSGMCQLELGQSSTAIDLFDQVVSMQSEKYTRPSYWYQALAYLYLGNTEKATTIFEHLQQGEDVYARKALDLLDQL
jgi:tetratricopeptide (TPR) repeat protein